MWNIFPMFIQSHPINKPITAEDIQWNNSISKEVLQEIQIAYDQAESASSDKRSYHRHVDEVVKTLHPDKRINYDLNYSYKKSFIAMFQNEGMEPVFSERDYHDRETTRKFNKAASFDIENMKKKIKDKKMLWDVYDYGPWLRIYNWFDMISQCPTYIVPSPLSRYYDPNGNVYDNNFDYHIFSRQTSLPELNYNQALTWGYFNLDSVFTGTYTRNSENQDGKRERLQTITEVNQETVYVYNCYVTFNWHRYFAVVANDLSLIIKRERIMPLTDEEKKDGTLVPFPIAISNANANPYDPWGISYREKVYPVQQALDEVTNAIHSKQLRDAWHDIVWYDIDRVDNIADFLTRPVWWPLFVPVEWLGQWPVTQPLLENNDTSKSTQYIQQLEFYAENTTALTWIVRWLSPNVWTLWEAEIQLQKSNALFWVDAETLAYWEKQFWFNIRYRYTRLNLPKMKEKTMVLGIDNADIVKIENSEMKWFSHPYITIKSKRKENEDKTKKISTMQAMLPIITQDPNVNPISVKMFKRQLMELQWLDEWFIYAVEPMTPSERHSKKMQEIVNAWQKPENLFIPWLDLETLWIYMNSALDNDQKEDILSVLNMRMVEEGLWTPKTAWDAAWLEWIVNSMWSQAMSADIANNRQSLPWPESAWAPWITL